MGMLLARNVPPQTFFQRQQQQKRVLASLGRVTQVKALAEKHSIPLGVAELRYWARFGDTDALDDLHRRRQGRKIKQMASRLGVSFVAAASLFHDARSGSKSARDTIRNARVRGATGSGSLLEP